MNDILEKLNEEQIKPVMQTEGPVLVLAGAGSGKTRVLTSRIAHLIEDMGVPSSAILAITFTNKAANEMKERLSSIVDISRSWVCTIHSMCVRILRMFALEAGIHANFSIYSETERNNIIKKSYKECGYDEDEGENLIKKVKWHIGNAKMLGCLPVEYRQVIDDEYAGEIIKVYELYQKHLKENNALDFDDLLNETRGLLRKNKEVREYLGSQFRYILVDEFQDTNAVQYEIIKMLASMHGNLFVVGDDDQSIYGWRGAKIENILNFEKDFKGAHVFKLERNYRSTKNILNLANAIIRNNNSRKNKTLWTDNEEGPQAKVYEADKESGEARYIAQVIDNLRSYGYRYSDFAILMRINALTRSFEEEFTRKNIPFKIFGGLKFFERKEVKDILAYLRIIDNPLDNEAITRIINFPKRGIGVKTVETLQSYASEMGSSIYETLVFDLDDLEFASGTKQKLANFGRLIKGFIHDSQDLPINKLVLKIIEDTEMRRAYDENTEEGANRLANINELINSVDQFSKDNPTALLKDYLSQVSLYTDLDAMDNGNYVILATIHSVKGLEFNNVFICGLEDNILPTARSFKSSNDFEEERRLMYVAITRAKERLYLTRSRNRWLYNKREDTIRSSFLNELSDILDLPKETRPQSRGYSDWDDPDSYGNSAYGGGRYASNDDYSGRRTSFGGGYKTYGDSSRSNSGVTRSAWNGGSSYGSGFTYGSSTSSYGSGTTYGSQTSPKSSPFVYGGAGKVAKPTTGKKDLSIFKVGVKVRHAKFGVGTIVSVRGVDNNMILNVAFEGLGIKQLSATLAPLTVI